MQRRLVQNFTYIVERGQGTCTLTKRTRCWTYSALRHFFYQRTHSMRKVDNREQWFNTTTKTTTRTSTKTGITITTTTTTFLACGSIEFNLVFHFFYFFHIGRHQTLMKNYIYFLRLSCTSNLSSNIKIANREFFFNTNTKLEISQLATVFFWETSYLVS